MIDLLRRRKARGVRPFDDAARIALVVEGGAMRGVISAGMVWALEDLGYGDVFDAVYGSSAGAINAAYFLAGQAGLGTSIYYEDINNTRFIDLARPVRGRPIVNLAFLLDDVARHRKRLDAERVLRAASPLTVIATDVDARISRPLRGFRTAAQLFDALRASATMPVVAGEPSEYEGRRYLDASITEPIPIPTAEREGHTHVLALLTRGGGMRPKPSALDRYFVGPRLRRLSPDLAARYLGRSGPYAALIRDVDAGTGPLGRTAVRAIRVSDYPIGRLERRRPVLERGARLGYDAIMRAFET
ncbi:MAG: patatin-like phospholipase family protein [Acidobacteria bacterium]|nr:patatin-like phospholipase family protein [Acidobacteriota bacterium]